MQETQEMQVQSLRWKDDLEKEMPSPEALRPTELLASE